ncbi:PREDICTED: uncharacterized protein LOC108361529 isoform X1 [Rhagoletis zephyria]|uniref:uncharacterized protein LOC108361529 isoform X1 n=1 Tax=Rhagoletis zephyria TaxID=28612 RepID=UPI000811936B|nr:PREDICTED: uncharacterized protein LOC108361529 isoform X1 [Rhagoletis zephyria]
MFSSADVAAVRHVVQRILVPCVFVIGLLGNSVSIYVLTRKRMRCTTNIYLTALAITDIIYLTMALLLSLKHYDYVQRQVEIYWKCYGYVVWLCDACAYISIYIAVCFTIERFIAIRYPLKRQTFCTESLAKSVITGVVLFCLFSTISTAFEHQYRITKKSIDIHGSACNITLANAPDRLSLLQLNYNERVRQQQQQQRRQKDQQDGEQNLPVQHYMPTMPTSIATPYIDIEGSGGGQAVADERTEQRSWQTRSLDSTIGAVANKEDNLDSRSSSRSRKLKPDVILRRLKRKAEGGSKHAAAATITATTPLPLTALPHTPLLSLATPLPIALTTGDAVTLGWSELAAVGTTAAAASTASAIAPSGTQVKASAGSLLKGAFLTAANRNIPSIIVSYLPLDRHSEHLFDSEFLMSAGISLGSEQSVNEKDEEPKKEQLIADYNGVDEEWTQQTQTKDQAATKQNAEAVFFNITDYCEEVTYYQNCLSSLGENALYTRLWYFFTLFIFVLIPLCLLATFNCFLIMLVRRSKNLRGEMTNANSIRRSRMSSSSKGPRKAHSSSVSQENRITVTLIAVVLLFIVCQLPWAIYLIVSENVDIDNNVQAIIGNIFNFLAAINAAANFFLYCVLSDKYRKTVRELITGNKYRAYARNTSATASLYTSTHASQALNGSRRYRPTSTSLIVK